MSKRVMKNMFGQKVFPVKLNEAILRNLQAANLPPEPSRLFVSAYPVLFAKEFGFVLILVWRYTPPKRALRHGPSREDFCSPNLLSVRGSIAHPLQIGFKAETKFKKL